MKSMKLVILILSLVFFSGCSSLGTLRPSGDVGDVRFKVSCNEKAQAQFNHSLALLHHMMYAQAKESFRRVTSLDDKCAMGHWGIAMSLFHPLWPVVPSAEKLAEGEAALQKARSLTPQSQIEKDFIGATSAFYQNYNSLNHKARLAAWEKTQRSVYKKYPNDIDAAALFALSHIATAPKADKRFEHQEVAGKILEDRLASNPRHPGVYHYIIHAYDNPKLAPRALEVARGYDKIAPNVPHALHMPTHIFVRLGLWQDTIDWNIRSAEAALDQPVADLTSHHYPHAIDYMIYGYLQQGQDDSAREVLEELLEVDDYQKTSVAAYGLAAAQARIPLELHDWEAAANLAVRSPVNFPWDDFPWIEAITYYTRGIGAARSGDVLAARDAVAMLDQLYQKSVDAGEKYWTVHVDAKRKVIEAWISFTEGGTQNALAKMRQAAKIEDSVDKHPVTPGTVLPARELYGDMLLALNRPKQAIAAYQASLKISPNRLNSLLGTGESYERLGNTLEARKYYSRVIELTENAEGQRQTLDRARTYLAQYTGEESKA